MKKIVCFGLAVMLFLPLATEAKVGGGDIVFKPAGAKNVLYSHDIHASKFGIKCKECHPKIFAMSSGYGKTTMANMEAGASCGVCHDGKRAFSVKGAAGCGRCHQ